jgi:hypothetical protein
MRAAFPTAGGELVASVLETLARRYGTRDVPACFAQQLVEQLERIEIDYQRLNYRTAPPERPEFTEIS